MSWSADGRVVAAATFNGRAVWTWDAASGKELAKVQADLPEVNWHAVLSPDGKLLATGGKELKIWESSGGKQVRALPGRANPLAWSPDGKALAAWINGEIGVVDPQSGEIVRRLDKDVLQNCRAAWSADPKLLAVSAARSAASDATLRIWEMSSGRLVHRLSDSAYRTRPPVLRWLPDGRHLVAADENGAFRWNTEDEKLVSQLRLPGWGSVDISPDGRLAARRLESATRLDSLEDGRLIGTLVPLLGDHSLVVSAEGHYAGTPGVEEFLRYVVQTDSGQETLAPEEFGKRHGWKNDPQKALRAVEAAVAPPAKPKTEPGVPSPVPSAK
jgi:hypothetical protein